MAKVLQDEASITYKLLGLATFTLPIFSLLIFSLLIFSLLNFCRSFGYFRRRLLATQQKSETAAHFTRASQTLRKAMARVQEVRTRVQEVRNESRAVEKAATATDNQPGLSV